MKSKVTYSYNKNTAEKARTASLDGLKQEDYAGTCVKSHPKTN
jgi:hypothetical protein